MRCPTGAAQRGAHIAGQHDADPLEQGRHGREVDRGDIGQARPAGPYRHAVVVEHDGAERTRSAHPAIGGCAAAQADDEITAAEFDRGFHGQADAVRGGLHRLQVTGRQLGKTADLGEFDQRGRSMHSDPGRCRAAEGICGWDVPNLEAGGENRLQSPVAAISDRAKRDLDRCLFCQQSRSQLGAHVGGGQAALELVDCQ